jgi:mannose-6-phosphate isomerase-like protein (cupin superfamily)
LADEPLNLFRVFDGLEEWAPQVVGAINDYDVKIAAVDGDFPRHNHEETDEFFLVLAGTFTLHLDDRDVVLEQGDAYTVPRGVYHRPHAAPGTRILMVEPRGTFNTGDASTGTTGNRLV